jgi:hypothetical protein
MPEGTDPEVQTTFVREARLRPESASRYPGIPAGVWIPAAELGARLLMQHLAAPGPATLGSRLLDDAHFEFRGGFHRRGAGEYRTRWGEREADRPVA